MKRRRFAAAVAFGGTWSCLALAHAQPAVVVVGDDACPSAEMIRAAWLAARPDAAWPDRPISVTVAGDRLVLGLGDDPPVRREVPADADCTVRAESVAVVIAAWSGELAAHPTDAAVLIVATPAPVLAPGPLSRHVVEAEVAALYSAIWGHAPGARVAVGRSPRTGGLGARLFGAYQSGRDIVLEGGANQLMRFLVGAAATYERRRRRLFAAADVGVVATLTRAQGSGYETDRAAYGTNFGGMVGLRGGVRLGRVRLWVGAGGLRLVRAETVKVQSSSPGVADRAVLSAWDAELGLGLGFRFE